MSHDVTLVPGDTTGPEIFAFIRPLLADLGVDVRWDEPGPTATHTTLLESARRTKVVLMGYERGKREEGQLPPVVVLRRELGVYANLRPIQSLPGGSARFTGVDLWVVRETSEDVYAHLEHESIPGVFESFKVTTRDACARIARFAYDLARAHGRKRVTIVHKANILKKSDGLFLRTCREVGLSYPDLTTDDVIVDALCMKLVLDPTRFDVLVAGNLFGDIVSDLCTGLVGRGNAPSINVGADGVHLFTAGHGDPPDLAGSGRGNPLTLLMPVLHLLRHLGETNATASLEQGIRASLSQMSPDGVSLDAFFGTLHRSAGLK